MKFLLIYGPPAVGKLTVAREIARLTGMKLFDNHATINAVRPVFDYDAEPFLRVLRTVRLAIIEEAAQAGVDLIHTIVYLHPPATDYINELAAAVSRHGGRFFLLRLKAERALLDQRVLGEGRRERDKLADVSGLGLYLSAHRADEAIPGHECLTIDNSRLSPEQVAELAIAHFGLPRVAEPRNDL